MTARRATLAQINAIIGRINTMTGSPAEPWSKDSTGRYRANIGCYHLSQAYGGCALHRMQTEGGGVSDVLRTGHVSKGELVRLMFAYINGLEASGSDR